MNNLYRQNLICQTLTRTGMAQLVIREDKKAVAKNLYLSGIAEECIAMQLDLETPAVVQVLKEQGVYKTR
jgi:hypothetical protein